MSKFSRDTKFLQIQRQISKSHKVLWAYSEFRLVFTCRWLMVLTNLVYPFFLSLSHVEIDVVFCFLLDVIFKLLLQLGEKTPALAGEKPAVAKILLKRHLPPCLGPRHTCSNPFPVETSPNNAWVSLSLSLLLSWSTMTVVDPDFGRWIESLSFEAVASGELHLYLKKLPLKVVWHSLGLSCLEKPNARRRMGLVVGVGVDVAEVGPYGALHHFSLHDGLRWFGRKPSRHWTKQRWQRRLKTPNPPPFLTTACSSHNVYLPPLHGVFLTG